MLALKSVRTAIALLLATVISHGLCSQATRSRDASATIQATAHVEAAIGLTDVFQQVSSDFVGMRPESRLFWLYHPFRDGMCVQIDRGDRPGSSSLPPDTPCFVPEVLESYPLASLISLDDLRCADTNDSSPITITLIFTNN